MSVALAVTVAAVLVVAALTVWCGTRVRRLDRLHRRVDAARAGLGEALGRRVQVAARVADVVGAAGVDGADVDSAGVDSAGVDSGGVDGGGVDGAGLRAAARTAGSTHAPAPDGRDRAGARQAREAAENVLTRELATIDPARLDPALAVELADAEQLVVLARRVHNDAVRDTLGLRSRRLVRWLHLAGTAPVPVYFEIVDPGRRDPSGDPAGDPAVDPAGDRAGDAAGDAPDEVGPPDNGRSGSVA